MNSRINKKDTLKMEKTTQKREAKTTENHSKPHDVFYSYINAHLWSGS